MSARTATTATDTVEAPPSRRPSGSDLPSWAQAGMTSAGRAALILAFVVAIAQITGEDALVSGGTAGATLRLMLPILFAALGGIFAERSGIVNIGLEGMMILGTWFGAYFGFESFEVLGVSFGGNAWWGLLFSAVGGALGGVVLGLSAVTFGVDHVVAGVALNLIAPGITRFLAGEFFIPAGGSLSNSPQIQGKIGTVDLPYFGAVSWAALLGLAMVPVLTFVLWRTSFGLRLRSAGEHPWGADSLGVPVYRMQWYGVLISGALAGAGGGLLVVDGANIYREGQTGGRGFIALAAVIFGNWRPQGALVGSVLFGYILALQLRSESAVHALLLAVAVAGLIAAAWFVWKKQYTPAVWTGVVGVVVGIIYFATESLPSQLVFTAPYVVTLLVLVFASQRLRPPKAVGLRWRKGDIV